MATNIISVKMCSSCMRELSLDQFGACSAYKDGLRGQCRKCRSRLQIDYIKRHPKKRKPQSFDDVRRYLLGRKYGITQQDYLDMLANQGGVCAICGTESAGGKYGTFHVDHCHDSGVVRGLLCHRCNYSLGMVGDNLEGVMRFVKYLEAIKTKNMG